MKSPSKFLGFVLVSVAACSGSTSSSVQTGPSPSSSVSTGYGTEVRPPSPDPRVGLKVGVFDAGQALWNMRLVSATPTPPAFVDSGGHAYTNSDLGFLGNYAIQGNYNGFIIWDISDPSRPVLKDGLVCPASQSDVSVYKNLLIESSEAGSARLDCGTQGVKDPKDRIRGVRVWNIDDIGHPKLITSVQTCRGSHTHTLLVDPKDPANIYVYISGQAGVRPAEELAGCSGLPPEKDPNTSRYRIDVIKIPLAHPEQAAVAGFGRIFEDLGPVHGHGEPPPTAEELADRKRMMDAAKRRGAFIVGMGRDSMVLADGFVKPMLDSVAKAGGHAMATAADSAALRQALPGMFSRMVGGGGGGGNEKPRGPDQCHDITVYPAIGLAGGACAGYGMLLDIRDPLHPVRTDFVSDSNFQYWHSATLNNDGTKVLFSDEWGGGGGPKCRATDKLEWGSDAIFTIENGKMKFHSYYKMPAAQTRFENCVAHNGSLIPIPGRDVMVQAWYQGGVSVFDWTDADHPREIAFFDRGPMDSTKLVMAGSWSAYWYNGVIVSSEIARGLDILELTPSPLMSQNEIDAAKSVHADYLNVQGQPKFVWPATFALARAYLDQLERSRGLDSDKISSARSALSSAEQASGDSRRSKLSSLAEQLHNDAPRATDSAKVHKLASAVGDLANARR